MIALEDHCFRLAEVDISTFPKDEEIGHWLDLNRDALTALRDEDNKTKELTAEARRLWREFQAIYMALAYHGRDRVRLLLTAALTL